MSLRFGLLLATTLAATGAAGGCATEVDLPWSAGPTGTPTGTPSPSPISTTLPAGQDIVLNECFPVVSGSGTTLQANPGAVPVSVTAGTRLLVLQTQDAPPGAAVSSDPGAVIAIGSTNAGLWELAIVAAVAQGGGLTTVTLLGSGVANTYTNAASGSGRRSAQACTVPVFAMLVIPAGTRVLSPLWDKNQGFGGVLALEVVPGGIVEVNGELLARGRGFQSGNGGGSGGIAGSTGNVPCEYGAEKGEGIFGPYSATPSCGRPAWGTGGGGGNGDNAGGGGGSNAAGAGSGGGTYSTGDQNYGLGGVALSAEPAGPRLLLGGGGGGGEGGTCPGRGGNGGGAIALLGADGALVGTGSVDATAEEGQTPGDACGNSIAGAGGGGAGGTILATVDASAFQGGMHANGGTGGNLIDPNLDTLSPYGCGGGGSGGRIYSNAPVENVIGGEAGQYESSGTGVSACLTTSAGGSGVTPSF